MKKSKVLALLLGCSLLSSVGCSPSSTVDPNKNYEDNGEFYEIVYYCPISLPSGQSSLPDMGEVVDEINAIIKPEINAELKVVQLNWYEYNNLMSTRIASGEAYDLCYTSPSANYYWTNIKREAFLPIDTLLADYGQNIKKSVPDYMWEQAKYSDGHIYGIVNQQIIPRTDAVMLNSLETFDEFCLATPKYAEYNQDTIYQYLVANDLHPYDMLEEYAAWLQETDKSNGSIGVMGALNVDYSLQTRYHWDDLGTGTQVPGVVKCEDDGVDGIAVFNQFETDEFKADIQRVAEYYTSGLISNKIKDNKGEGSYYYDISPNTTWKPNALNKNTLGETGGTLRLGESYYYIQYVLGSMTAISSTSKNPARVMKFLDLLWSDARILNLLCFGVEDIHYEKVESEDNLKIKMISTAYDNTTMTWAYGNEFLDGILYLDTYESNPYEKSKEVNDEAFVSDVIGFVFDESPVTIQIANCKSVCSTYLTEFSTGQHGSNVMTVYNKFLSELDAAGMDEVIEEKQRQLDAWLASK